MDKRFYFPTIAVQPKKTTRIKMGGPEWFAPCTFQKSIPTIVDKDESSNSILRKTDGVGTKENWVEFIELTTTSQTGIKEKKTVVT